MVLGIALILGGIVFIILMAASLRPNHFKISRSILVSSPAKACFDQVNNFHQWEKWSPWAKLDPNMKTLYEGPDSGEGAVYSWNGAGKVGAGKMTVVKSQPAQLIEIQLDFLRPMKVTNQTLFTFEPEGNGTRVNWSMTGRNNLVAKVFHLLMNMEKMVGPDFEKGLEGIKAAAESEKA